MPKSVTRTADPEAEVNAADTDVTEVTETEKVKQRRTPPTYLAEEVADFPEDEDFGRARGSGRESVYINLMTDIAKNRPGKVILLVEFVTANTAGDVIKAFQGYTDSKNNYHEPTRVVPVGELSDWTFKAQKIKNPDTVNDPVKQGRPYRSRLYVRYDGPPIVD